MELALWRLVFSTSSKFLYLLVTAPPPPTVRASDYMPHLSLIYGDLSDSEKAELKDTCRSEYGDLLNVTFTVKALDLYRTNPADLSMASWEKLGTFPLEA